MIKLFVGVSGREVGEGEGDLRAAERFVVFGEEGYC